jgi:hypothetical protein
MKTLVSGCILLAGRVSADHQVDYCSTCKLTIDKLSGNDQSKRLSNSPSLQSSTQRSSICTNRTSISDPRSSLLSTASSRTSYYEFPNTDPAQHDSSMHSSTSDQQSTQQASYIKAPLDADAFQPTTGLWKRLPDLPTRSAFGQSRKALPKQKHFCTFCPKECGRKADWIRHEEEFHEPQEKYICTDCRREFALRDRFVRHHTRDHGCSGCVHADACRIALEPKKAYGCGFCGQCLTSWSARMQHLAEHQGSGKKRDDWDHSRIILGLLCQDELRIVWCSLLAKHHEKPWPRFVWNYSSTIDLQRRLESGGGPHGWSHADAEALVQDAYARASPIPSDTVMESDKMDLCQDLLASASIDPLPMGLPSIARPDSGVFPDFAESYSTTYGTGTDNLLQTASAIPPTLSGFLSFQGNYVPERMAGEPSLFYSDAGELDGLLRG